MQRPLLRRVDGPISGREAIRAEELQPKVERLAGLRYCGSQVTAWAVLVQAKSCWEESQIAAVVLNASFVIWSRL